MKALHEVVSSLQYTQEILDPVLTALHQHDDSELFLSVGPGIAAESYALVQEALRRALEDGWYAGRRGRISKLLIDVLGGLQQAIHTPDSTEAARHATAAIEHLRDALAGLGRIAATPRRRP